MVVCGGCCTIWSVCFATISHFPTGTLQIHRSYDFEFDSIGGIQIALSQSPTMALVRSLVTKNNFGFSILFLILNFKY